MLIGAHCVIATYFDWDNYLKINIFLQLLLYRVGIISLFLSLMRLSVNNIPEYTRYIITIPDNADNELLMIK